MVLGFYEEEGRANLLCAINSVYWLAAAKPCVGYTDVKNIF